MDASDIKAQELAPIFPTPLWLFDVSDARREALSPVLAAEVQKLTNGEPGQTRQDLHLLPEFAGLVEVIRYGADQALASLHMDQYEYEITALWANIHYPGMSHGVHVHPNNYLGGTYYLQVNEGSNMITFTDPRGEAMFVRPKPSELTPLNMFKISYEVAPGRLVMFPAWLGHEVPINKSDQPRISLSFNTMFSDFNAISRPQWDPSVKG